MRGALYNAHKNVDTKIRQFPYPAPPRIMHIAHPQPPNHRTKVVRGQIHPSQLAQHGTVGAGCIWQAPQHGWRLPSRGYAPYPALTCTSTYHAHCSSMTCKLQSRGGLRSDTPYPACTAHGSRCRLHMVSSATWLDIFFMWICTVSSSHIHLHVPCTLLIYSLCTTQLGWFEVRYALSSLHSTEQ
jgi:hypothetical protein